MINYVKKIKSRRNINNSVIITRFLVEMSLLGIGLIAAKEYVTVYSLLITVLAGPVIHVIYQAFKFKPTKTEHKYLISRKNN